MKNKLMMPPKKGKKKPPVKPMPPKKGKKKKEPTVEDYIKGGM